jgi:hypothetical protein
MTYNLQFNQVLNVVYSNHSSNQAKLLLPSGGLWFLLQTILEQCPMQFNSAFQPHNNTFIGVRPYAWPWHLLVFLSYITFMMGTPLWTPEWVILTQLFNP